MYFDNRNTVPKPVHKINRIDAYADILYENVKFVKSKERRMQICPKTVKHIELHHRAVHLGNKMTAQKCRHFV